MRSGTLARRHTSGGKWRPTDAPARTSGAMTRVLSPGRTNGRVFSPRTLIASGGVDAEERADRSERHGGTVDEIAVPHHVHLLAGEVGEEVLELLAVEPEAPVVPEQAPAGGDAVGLGVARRFEVGDRLEPVGPEVHPVRVRPIDRVAHDGDELRVGYQRMEACVRRGVVEVEGRALAEQRAGRRAVEQRFVAVALPDPLLRAVRVARAVDAFGEGHRRTGSTSAP